LSRGVLYLVGTPIGNLGDLTARVREVLARVTRIYAEDTRRTLTLLSHLKIEGPRLLSLHAHSSDKTIDTALEILEGGDNIALVTDAGMPTVSDPGTELVRRAHEKGIVVTVIPGPSAVTSAVAASGLVDGPFTFLGFLPRRGTKRRAALDLVRQLPHPTVLFEAPTRLTATLHDLHEVLGARTVAICRELTKRHEEVLVVSLADATVPHFRDEWLGEVTLVIDGNKDARTEPEEQDVDEQIQQLLAQGLSVKDVATQLSKGSRDRGIKSHRRELYARAELLRDEAREQEELLGHDAELSPESDDLPGDDEA
jgi:16S rRNA (cytidine1402-2'-O)-methyltransferase